MDSAVRFLERARWEQVFGWLDFLRHLLLSLGISVYGDGRREYRDIGWLQLWGHAFRELPGRGAAKLQQPDVPVLGGRGLRFGGVRVWKPAPQSIPRARVLQHGLEHPEEHPSEAMERGPAVCRRS